MTPPAPPAPAPPTAAPRHLARWIVLAVALAGLVVLLAWLRYRAAHSITNDAFIDSDMLVYTPQVAGEIVEMLVVDQEFVRKGQLMCRLDPTIYSRTVALDQARLVVAQAVLLMSQAKLALLEARVPVEIAVAAKALAIAQDDLKRSEHALSLITDTVRDQIVEAEKAVEAARATAALAKVTYERYEASVKDGAVSLEERDIQLTRYQTTVAQLNSTEAALANAISNRKKIDIEQANVASARNAVLKAEQNLELARTGTLQIAEQKQAVAVDAANVERARRELAVAEANLAYTYIYAPFDGWVAKRLQYQGDYGQPGVPIFSLYAADNVYCSVYLEETRLRGVAVGSRVRLDVDAFSEPFHGTVAWVGRASQAKFDLIPRDVGSGEFTKVVQRFWTRVNLDLSDPRYIQLRPGLSVTVTIEHRPVGSVPTSQMAAE